MTLFQGIAITGLSLALLFELVQSIRGRAGGLAWLLRCVTWASAALAITFPQQVTQLAAVFGIRRGADLLTYLLALAFVITSFYFYSRYVRLQRQVTDLVRHLAIREASRGPATDENE
jgi:hypothetical protein